MTLLSWKELSEKRYEKAQFLIDPYLPREGVVLLWAGSSVGKSPLTWEMARAVGEGGHFFGLPATEGRVLYVEVDTPEQLLADRLRLGKVAKNVWFLVMKPLSVPTLSEEEKQEFAEAKEEVKPDLVILNTLRKLHDLDDKESRTPKVVYGFFQHLFPKSTLLFVHHERKQNVDPRMLQHDQEDYSGSKAWINDAQVGLHLKPHDSKELGGEKKAPNLNLFHVKSQVSEQLLPLPLYLEGDGTNLSSPLYEELLKVYEALGSEDFEGVEKQVFDDAMGKALGVSPTTAKRRRLLIENGKFPGSRGFLSRREERV